MQVTTTARAKINDFSTAVARAKYQRGAAGALKEALGQVIGVSRRAGGYLVEAVCDYRYGMNTRGIVRNGAVVHGADGTGDGTFYQATPVRTLRRIVAAADIDQARTTFLDLGCGRGRAVLLAAQAGFARSIGVDLDPQLCAQAQDNVRRSRLSRAGLRSPAGRIEIRVGDAAEADLPLEDLLVFLFNPFGAETLQRVLDRLCASQRSHPRRITVCYSHPVHASVVDGDERFRQTSRGKDWRIYVCSGAAAG
jgi:SAM-dependent methyltransferase